MISVSSIYSAVDKKVNKPVYRVTINGTEYSTSPIKANYADEVLSDGPNTYWRFGESVTSPPTTVAADASGNGVTGVYAGPPTLGLSGALTKDANTSVGLVGTSQTITFADNDKLDPGDVLSIEFWIYLNGGTITEKTIFTKNTNSYKVTLKGPVNHIAFYKDGVGTSIAEQDNVNFPALSLNTWYHVVITKSGATTHIYVNGTDETSAGTNATIAANANDLVVGGVSAMDYRLDEFAIYPVALSAARVQAHYDAGLMLFNRSNVLPYMRMSPTINAAQIIPERGQSSSGDLAFTLTDVGDYDSEVLADVPAIYLKLNDLKGTSAADFSGNGLNGVYVGGPQLGQLGPSQYVETPDWSIPLGGTATSVTVADNDKLDPGDTLSLEFWINVSAYPSPAKQIFTKGTNSYAVTIGTNLLVTFFKVGGSTIATSNNSGPTYNANAWHHVLITKSGATTHIYIDGVDVTVAGTNDTIAANATGLTLGGTAGIGFNFARFALYPTALSLDRAIAHYNAMIGRPANTANGAITRLAAIDPSQNTVTLSLGFESIREADYIQIPAGIVDSYALTNDLTGYQFVVRDPQTLTNKQLFNVAIASLQVSMGAGDTQAVITDASAFNTAGGYAVIDNEDIQYSSITSVGVPPPEAVYSVINFANSATRILAVSNAAESADGLSWIFDGTFLSNNTSWTSWDYSPSLGLYVAVGGAITSNAHIATSPDFITWTLRDTGNNYGLVKVKWSTVLGLFITVGQNNNTGVPAIVTSSDGITWTSQTSPDTTNGGKWLDLGLYESGGNAHLVIVAGTSNTTFQAATSTNGTAWTGRAVSEANGWTALAFSPSLGSGSGRWASVSATGTHKVMTSDDHGVTWSNQTATNGCNHIEWSSPLSLYLATTGTTATMTSADAVTWSGHTTSVAVTLPVWTGTYFLCITTVAGSRIAYSSDGVNFTQVISTLNSLTRGVLRTTAASHSAGATVKEMIRLGPSHPVDIITSVLENTDKTGLSISASLVDGTGLAALKTLIGSSYQMDFRITAAVNAKSWLEQQIFQPLGLYPVTSSGKYSVHQIQVITASVDAITHDDIVLKGGVPQITWDRNFKSTIINSVTFLYDFDGSNYNTTKYFPGSSIGSKGEYPLVIKSNGLRSELVGTVTLITTVANTFLTRYNTGAPLVTIIAALSKNIDEPGDSIDVTTTLLANHATKARGITAAQMELMSRAINLDQGTVDMRFLWFGSGW